MASAAETIGSTVRELRLKKGLSQGDVEKRCGLLRCYLSRVEQGHTIPSLSTLEKLAEALETPLSEFFPGTRAVEPGQPLSFEDLEFLRQVQTTTPTGSGDDD